jgi:hypothetical protein
MWKALSVLALTVVLGGCASMNQLANDVSTYSVWPADRKPATYAFERLPSQQTQPQQMELLENAAARAMQLAGFTPAPDPKAADVTVTLGARVTPNQLSPYDDPFWWHGGLWAHRFYPRPYWRYGPYWGHPFGSPFYASPTYEREVAMLIRDRKTGQPLYEARVTNDGYSPSINSLLSAMFEAGLKDFPAAGGTNPRRVVTQISAS